MCLLVAADYNSTVYMAAGLTKCFVSLLQRLLETQVMCSDATGLYSNLQ